MHNTRNGSPTSMMCFHIAMDNLNTGDRDITFTFNIPGGIAMSLKAFLIACSMEQLCIANIVAKIGGYHCCVNIPTHLMLVCQSLFQEQDLGDVLQSPAAAAQNLAGA